ncbi:MAG: hypothetical protein WA919_09630 [Coleofasciculaceae cyanobacterium]
MVRKKVALHRSPIKLLEIDDPVYAWRGRMLDLYNGLAAKAVGYDV